MQASSNTANIKPGAHVDAVDQQGRCYECEAKTAPRTAPATGGNVCKAETYSVVEDRPVVKERVHQVREHHNFEREMVKEHKVTGRERELPGAHPVEHLGTTERIIETTPPKACP